MSTRRRFPLILKALLVFLLSLLFGVSSQRPSTANHAVPQGDVEVVPASRRATTTEPLRGLPPSPVTLGPGRKIKRVRLNPNVLVSLGPALRDPVLQSTVSRTTQTAWTTQVSAGKSCYRPEDRGTRRRIHRTTRGVRG